MMLALRADRLLDETGRVRAHGIVLVAGSRIVDVRHGSAATPAAAEVIDLGDATLLPGLIDVHQHLGFDASADPVTAMAARDDDALLASMEAAALDAVRAGVTTVRDLGDRTYLSLELRDRLGTRGPHIVAAGPPVTTVGGHCHFMGGAGDAGSVRDAVRERAERGVDVIKVMTTGGNLTPGTDPAQTQYTLAELRALVDEAHAQDLPVTAHAHATEGIRIALDAGVDGIEHCTFQTPDGFWRDPALVDRVAASRVAVCVTAGRPANAPPLAPHLVPLLAGMRDAARALAEAGAHFVAGTDAGVPHKPHGALAWHLVYLHEVGVQADAALRAATVDAAAACGLGARKGRLAAGYDADVIAVGGDPSVDLHALFDVRTVMRAGTVLHGA
jgi:imidazolonepropionase-like amidohydrolase